ncbi:hypothetical protein FVE85_2431 [Porphyridium purpureum]|uniref:Uncharacterized protein n=1 Tax=Porphyridium purpureum TaxID=35688 RepID=A0A5J4YFK4_PORPP|nr:hypothetical protein FVE85_8535 [Porphyridium purpureum]KAA8490427.1 hypothetical protein FVE85_1216 [Porphyridium purpureum]KAA8491416.1 hypothetical protein FVE85_2431 [Porphyridium purpureum]|eukprot:POR6318..scf244_28
MCRVFVGRVAVMAMVLMLVVVLAALVGAVAEGARIPASSAAAAAPPRHGVVRLNATPRRAQTDDSMLDMCDGIIVRKSKKTGSSSFASILKRYITRTGVIALDTIWKNPGLGLGNHRWVLLNHNSLTRQQMWMDAGKTVCITDTFRSAAKQVTSHCVFFYNVSDCGDALIRCMKDPKVIEEILNYRYPPAGRLDASNRIDFVFNFDYPEMNRRVIKRVLGEELHVDVHGRPSRFSCTESFRVRSVIDKYYSALEKENEALAHTFAGLLGYSFNDTGVHWEHVLWSIESLLEGGR